MSNNNFLEEVKEVVYSHDFLKSVAEKWMDSIKECNTSEIIEEVVSVSNHGSNGGNVGFVIYTYNNENFLKENLSDMFEYVNDLQENMGKLENIDANSMMFMAVNEVAFIISEQINLDEFLNTEAETEDRGVFCLQL